MEFFLEDFDFVTTVQQQLQQNIGYISFHKTISINIKKKK